MSKFNRPPTLKTPNTYTESTESSSEGANASYSTAGTASGGVNTSKSSSESESTSYTNASLSAGSIVSNSDSLTIAGGNLSGGDIDITTDTLVVASLQDTSSSSNESQGGNVGFGGGSVSSVGINASQGESSSAWVSQQSGITGGTVNIKAKDTSITGATIAAVDENGNTTDNLTLTTDTLTTDTLTVANLEDTDTSKQMGIDLSYGGDSVTLGGNFSGHEKEQSTYATIGLGNVTVGGESIDDQAQFADLNRDTATSQEVTKDIERGGLDASLTVDHRLLTEAGRDKIKKDVLDTAMHVDEIGQAISDVNNTDQGVLDVFGNIQDYATERTVLAKQAMDEAAQKKLKGEEGAEGSQEGMQALSDALSKEQGLEENAEIALYDGSKIDDDTVAIDKSAVNKTEVEGAYHENSNGILVNIDNTNMTDSTEVATTVVHEQTRHRLAQEGETGSLSRDDQTTIATNHGDQAGQVWDAYSSLAGISTQSSTATQTSWNAANSSSAKVVAGTKQIAAIDNTELKARQLNTGEASLMDKAKASVNNNMVLTEEAKEERIQELTQLACAEVKCAAGVSVDDPLYDELKKRQNAGEALVADGADIHDSLHELGVDTPTTNNGRMQRKTETTFGYNGVTAAQDAMASNEEKVAVVAQAAQVGAGAVGVAGSTALCAGTVLGCSGAAVVGAASASAVATGVSALSSDHEYQNGQRVMDSFSLETTKGNYNPIADAALDIVPNLLVAGTAIKAVNSATNSLVLADDVVGYVNTARTSLNSTNTLSSTGGDIISGAVGGYSTGGSEGAITGALTSGFVSILPVVNNTAFLSGSISNALGQEAGNIKNYISGKTEEVKWYNVNLLEVGASGVANKTSTVFKALPSTQPTLGRALVGEAAAGVYIGTAAAVSPKYTADELVDTVFDVINEAD